jgi:hypothetical protein
MGLRIGAERKLNLDRETPDREMLLQAVTPVVPSWVQTIVNP